MGMSDVMSDDGIYDCSEFPTLKSNNLLIEILGM